ARLDRLGLDRDPERALMLDHRARADFVTGNFRHDRHAFWKSAAASRMRGAGLRSAGSKSGRVLAIRSLNVIPGERRGREEARSGSVRATQAWKAGRYGQLDSLPSHSLPLALAG